MTRRGICLRNVDDVLRAFLVDVAHDDVGEIQFTNNLNEMKRLVGSDVVELRKLDIEGRAMRVICDGHSPQRGKVSAVDPGYMPVLRGNLIIVGSHMEGKDEVLNSLSDTLMMHIRDHIGLVDIGSNDAKYNTYVLCDVKG